jgi:hypothetical protein
MREVARFLATPEPGSANTPSLTDAGSKTRLLRHLDNCIAEINAEIKDTKMELSKSPISQPSLHDSSSQDSTPLDFSKTGRKFQTSIKESKPKIANNPPPIIPQDENNNRDNEHSDSYPVSVITVPKKKAAMSRVQSSSKRLKVEKKVEVVSPASSAVSTDSLSVQDSNSGQNDNQKTQSVLLLPSHYVQLATGEFFGGFLRFLMDLVPLQSKILSFAM